MLREIAEKVDAGLPAPYGVFFEDGGRSNVQFLPGQVLELSEWAASYQVADGIEKDRPYNGVSGPWCMHHVDVAIAGENVRLWTSVEVSCKCDCGCACGEAR
jgi:hypothetical protein